VSAGLREELEAKEAELEALRAETAAKRTRLKRALRDAKTARDGWRAKHQEAVQRETGLEQKLEDLEARSPMLRTSKITIERYFYTPPNPHTLLSCACT
jgi:hypothetical protein